MQIKILIMPARGERRWRRKRQQRDFSGSTRRRGRIGREASARAVLTSARGSSDHAAEYFKYLTEILVGIPCASIGA